MTKLLAVLAIGSVILGFAISSTSPQTQPPKILTADVIGDWIGRWSSQTGFANTLYVTFKSVEGGVGKGTLHVVAAATGGGQFGYNRDLSFTASEAGEHLVIETTDGSFILTLTRVSEKELAGNARGLVRNLTIDQLKKTR